MPTRRHASTYTPWKAILQLEAAMEDGHKLTPHEYRLLLHMILIADRNGELTIGMTDLAASAGLSRNTITKSIPTFIEAGLIEKVDEGGHNDPSTYRVTL